MRLKESNLSLFLLSFYFIGAAAADTSSFGSTQNSYYFENEGVSQPKTSSNRSIRKSKDYSESRSAPKMPFSPDSHNLGIAVGQTFLMGGPTQAGDALGFQGQYTYGVSRLLGFDSSLGRSSHRSGEYSITSVRGGARVHLGHYDQMVPYLQAGVGFFKPSLSNPNETTYTSILFGVYAGGGLDLRISDQFFFGAVGNINQVFGSQRVVANRSVNLGGSSLQFMGRVGYTF